MTLTPGTSLEELEQRKESLEEKLGGITKERTNLEFKSLSDQMNFEIIGQFDGGRQRNQNYFGF